MFITIQKIEEAFTKSGAEYKKVTGIDTTGKQTTKSVFDNLKAKWGLLQENKIVEFKMQKVGQFWNVIDISEAQAPPAVETTTQTVKDTAKVEPVPEKGKIIPKTGIDSKNKSYALSYSKDLVSATLQAGQPLTKAHIKTVVKCANIFEAYLDGRIEFDEKQLAEFVLELNRKES